MYHVEGTPPATLCWRCARYEPGFSSTAPAWLSGFTSLPRGMATIQTGSNARNKGSCEQQAVSKWETSALDAWTYNQIWEAPAGSRYYPSRRTGMPSKMAQGRVYIAPLWPKSLFIAPVQLKSALGVPFCRPEEFRTQLCSQYHFRVYPGAGLANACPLIKKSH